MKLILSEEIIKAFPGINFKVLVFKNLQNERRSTFPSQLLRGSMAKIASQSKKNTFKDQLTNLFGETLVENTTLLETYLLNLKVKKISSNKILPTTNNFQDLIEYLSLRNYLPIFGFDLDEAETDYTINFYKPKRGKKTANFNFSSKTKNAVIWFLDLQTLELEEFEKFPQEFEQIIQKYCFGDLVDTFDLCPDSPEFDLNYISEKEKNYQQNKQKTTIDSDYPTTDLPQLENKISPIHFSTENLITNKLSNLLKTALKQLNLPTYSEEWLSKVEIEIAKEAKFGHFSSNLAMKIAKEVGISPQQLGEKLIHNLNDPLIEEITVVLPGFINFKLSQNYFTETLNNILRNSDKYLNIDLGNQQKVLIEYSSPNIPKPLGVHHLITTLLGQTLVNLYRASNFDVLAMNYPNDWGTQIGQMIFAFKNWGNKDQIEQNPMHEFFNLYVKFNELAQNNQLFESSARKEFQKLEEGDSENTSIWQWIKSISLKSLEDTYSLLGVKFDLYAFESEFANSGKAIVQRGIEMGIFSKGLQGAIIAEFPEEKLPTCVVQKSDGTSLYITRDLASLKARSEISDFRKIIYIVQAGQALHFNQLFALSNKLHLTNAELIHLTFGLMRLPEGKMSTRKGQIIFVDQLFEEADKKVSKLLAERQINLPEPEMKRLKAGIILGSVKYAFISQNPDSNIVFSWEKILTFEGNSAPYLQYTVARINSILAKSKLANEAEKNKQIDLFSIEHARREEQELSIEPFSLPEEQLLLSHISNCHYFLKIAVESNRPNLLTGYLFDLAQLFNNFYHHVHVLKTSRDDLRSSRLQLVEATAKILKHYLTILGIPTFERM